MVHILTAAREQTSKPSQSKLYLNLDP